MIVSKWYHYTMIPYTSHQSDFPTLFPRLLKFTKMGGRMDPLTSLNLHTRICFAFLSQHLISSSASIIIPKESEVLSKDLTIRPHTVTIGLRGKYGLLS